MADTPLWYSSHESLVNLAQHLVDTSELNDAHDVLAFFEKPWKWQAEWESYVEHQMAESVRSTVGVDIAFEEDPE